MTSASERTDDDVIVITADDLADQSQGAHAAPGPAGRETGDPELGDPELGDPEVGARDRADDRDTDDEPADDPAAPAYGAPAYGTSMQGTSMPGASAHGTSHAGPSPADQPGTDPAADLDSPAVDAEDQPGTSVIGSDLPSSDLPSSDPVAASSGPVTQPDVIPSTASTGSASVVTAVRPDENWPEIQAMFVDDPRSAVERAAEVTGGALDALVNAAKDREQSLRQNWQADGTGTEELRTSLQHYRELANRLSQLAAEL